LEATSLVHLGERIVRDRDRCVIRAGLASFAVLVVLVRVDFIWQVKELLVDHRKRLDGNKVELESGEGEVDDQETLPENVTSHVGTLDLDLGLAFALVGEQRYHAVAERLRAAGCEMDKNDDGQPTRQRWFISEPAVTVNFLIEPDDNAEAQAGRLFPLTRDWAAI